MAARKLQESSSLLDAATARAAAPVTLAARQRPLLAAMAAIGVLGLSGCAIGPDFVRPASTLPEQYAVSSGSDAAAEAASDAASEAAAIQPDWWKQFKDPVLDDLLDKALVQNADLRIAIARVEQAEAAAREAGGALLPQIDAQASGSRARYSAMNAIPLSGSTPVQRDARSAALTTSYELDVWGRVRRGYESVRASALASQYSRDAIRLSVAGLVTNSYLALRALDAQLAVADESLATRKTTLDLIRTRVDAGLVSPLDQHQAEGNLAAIAAQTASLRLQRAQTEHQLALLVGVPDLRIAAGDLRQLPVPPVPPAGLPSSLVQARPDVRQAEENLVSANAGIGVAKAGYFPKFTLTGSLGRKPVHRRCRHLGAWPRRVDADHRLRPHLGARRSSDGAAEAVARCLPEHAADGVQGGQGRAGQRAREHRRRSRAGGARRSLGKGAEDRAAALRRGLLGLSRPARSTAQQQRFAAVADQHAPSTPDGGGRSVQGARRRLEGRDRSGRTQGGCAALNARIRASRQRRCRRPPAARPGGRCCRHR